MSDWSSDVCSSDLSNIYGQYCGVCCWPSAGRDNKSGRREGLMTVSRFLIGGVASALLLTGGLFMWKGYSQIADEAVLPEPPPRLPAIPQAGAQAPKRSEEHTSELQSLMRISYAVFCLKKKKRN